MSKTQSRQYFLRKCELSPVAPLPWKDRSPIDGRTPRAFAEHYLYDYRELCPQSTVFSELHYLEEHIVKFVPKWKVGPGMMEEHGGESIYHQFNLLRNRCSSISLLSHARRALTDSASRLSFSSWASQKKQRKAWKNQFRIDDSPWHDCVQFFFWKKNDDGPGLKIW